MPVGFVRADQSPFPSTASTETAARIAGAWVEVVAGAGHFPWLERPGCVAAVLRRLR